MKTMFEYNFDPFTGEPIKKQEPQESPAPAQEEVAPIQEAAPAQEEVVPAQEGVAPAQEEVAPIHEEMQEAAEEEPIAKESAPAEEPPFAARPTAENPVYHYAYPKQEPPYAAPTWQPTFTPPPKKEQKPISRRTFIITIAAMLIFSLLLTAAGIFTTLRLMPGGKNMTGTAVIYKTAKLESADGNKQKEELTIPQVAELVKNSVVEITTEQIVTGSFMQQYVSEGAGSGVIFTADGYIVTNHHVIDGATNIKVRLANGTEHKATLIGSDAKSDLAVLKMEASDLTPAAFGTSANLKVGDTVVAVGNPLGELGGTVTRGIISALDRAITIDNTTMNLLQTDTAINPGNSGGGMFNTSGQLVGIVNAKNAGEEIEGLGFAIPIDTAKKVIEDLLQLGYVSGRVQPGFVFVEISDSMTAMMYRVSELGLYISETKSGSDAQKAGFKSGDLVISIEGKKVTTEAEANAIIDQKKAGETLKVVVKRSGSEKTLTMKLSEYIPAEEEEQTKMEPSTNTNGGIGNLFPFSW